MVGGGREEDKTELLAVKKMGFSEWTHVYVYTKTDPGVSLRRELINIKNASWNELLTEYEDGTLADGLCSRSNTRNNCPRSSRYTDNSFLLSKVRIQKY